MSKYEVQICRVEHTLYFVEVEADSEELAKELAYERFNSCDYDYEKVVHGEEFVHNIEELENV